MKIIERFASGLFSPKSIINYKNDNKGFTFLFFIILVIILIIPNIIMISVSNIFDYETKLEIRKAFNSAEEIPYEIVDNTLVFNGKDTEEKEQYVITLGNYKIIFSSNISESNFIEGGNIQQINFIFLPDGVYINNSIITQKIVEYADFDLNGLDFSEAKLTNMEFWNQAFTAMQKMLDSYKSSITVILIISCVIQAVGIIGLMSLLLTTFSRLGVEKNIKFLNHWQLMIYVMVPLVIGNVLSTLFGLGLFYLLGLLMTLVYSAFINQDQSLGGKHGI